MVMKKNIKIILGLIIVLTVAFYLYKGLFGNIKLLKQSLNDLNVGFILLSFLFILIAFYFGLLAWKYILSLWGVDISIGKALWTTAGVHLTKYVPGHVLILGSRVWVCSREGIPETISSMGIVMEMITQLAASCFMFLISYPFLSKHLSVIYYISGFAIFIFLLTILTPGILARIWKYIPRYGKKIKIDIKYKYLNVLVLLVIYIIAWSFQGLAIYFLIRSIYTSTDKILPIIVMGSYGGAYALGFLSVITPSGLGVREGLLTYVLKFFIPLPIAVLSSIMSRLAFTVVDVIMTIVALKFKKIKGALT